MSVKQRRLNNHLPKSEFDYRSGFHAEEETGWMSTTTPLLRSVDLYAGRDEHVSRVIRENLRDIDLERGRDRQRVNNTMGNIAMVFMVLALVIIIGVAFGLSVTKTTDFQKIVSTNDYNRMTLIDQGVVTVTPVGSSFSVLVDNRTSELGSHTMFIKGSDGKINDVSLESGKSYKIYKILDWYYVEDITPIAAPVVLPLEIIAR